MIGFDKVLHFAICAVTALIVTTLWGFVCSPVVAVITGFCVAMAAGLGKEYGDKCSPYNKWDWYDVLADVIGALLGCTIPLIWL